MPISADDLAYVGKTAIDKFLKNVPVAQIGSERPFLDWLIRSRKKLRPNKQNIVANIRKSFDSNFSFAFGEDPFLFNRRRPTETVQYGWKRAQDGLYIPHDVLFSHGVHVIEGERGEYKLSREESVQLLDYMEEQTTVLREGFLENLDLNLHRNGSASTDAIVGLDALVSVTPAVGTVGGINRATAGNEYWRNHVSLAVAQADILQKMEKMYRECYRKGKLGAPDFIMCGSDFLDAYAKALVYTNNADAAAVKILNGGLGQGTDTGLHFKKIPLVWNPKFDDLDDLETPATNTWKKRCYFLNSKSLRFHDTGIENITPVRPKETMALYMGVQTRATVELNKSSSNGVLVIS